MQNKLAKSRLKNKDQRKATFVPSVEKKFQTTKPVSTSPAAPLVGKSEISEKTYRTALPSLLIGFFFLIVVAVIMSTLQPYAIAHIPFQNMFLPFLLPLFLAVFFIFSYLFLNSKRGFFVATSVTCTVWAILVIPGLAIWIGIGFAVWYGALLKFS
jgi:hypothetical protein